MFLAPEPGRCHIAVFEWSGLMALLSVFRYTQKNSVTRDVGKRIPVLGDAISCNT